MRRLWIRFSIGLPEPEAGWCGHALEYDHREDPAGVPFVGGESRDTGSEKPIETVAFRRRWPPFELVGTASR